MNAIERINDQIESVKKSVRDFHSLESALDGKGGEAIRAFYRDCHEPFLVMLYKSMLDYKGVLREMGEAIDSLESGENGYISHSFLENEVEDALENIEKKAVNYTEEANEIIESVADLVSITEIDESDLVADIQTAKNNTDELISNLHELDGAQTAAIESTKEALNDMEKYVAELEQMFQDGDLSITEYSLDKMRKSDAFRTITENVYGEDGIIGFTLKKMENGEPLTDLERDNLYAYFQNEVLDDKKRDYIKDTAGNINEQDIDKLKEHLNDEVLQSKGALEEEITLLEAFLFTGREDFDIAYVDSDSREKLSAYLTMLKDYHSAIVSDDIYKLHAHTLEYKDQPDGVNEHVLKTNLELKSKSDDADTDGFFDMSRGTSGSYFYDAEITYFTTMDAAAFQNHLETKKLINKEVTFTRDFIQGKILSSVVGAIAKQGAPVIDGYISIAEHQAELNDLRDDIKVKEKIEPTSYLAMEFSITESETSLVNKGESKDSARHLSNDLHVERHPTQETYAILERWKEVHGYNSEIPYPEDAIQSQNWDEITKQIRDTSFGTDLYNHIFNDAEIIKNGKELEAAELAKEYK